MVKIQSRSFCSRKASSKTPMSTEEELEEHSFDFSFLLRHSRIASMSKSKSKTEEKSADQVLEDVTVEKKEKKSKKEKKEKKSKAEKKEKEWSLADKNNGTFDSELDDLFSSAVSTTYNISMNVVRRLANRGEDPRMQRTKGKTQKREEWLEYSLFL